MFFFFSSRRRHTRLQGDWSSDVCSSDLLINLVAVQIVPTGAGRNLREHPIGTGPYEFVSHAVDDRIVLRAFRDYFGGLRSEERRVGKEWMRWGATER